MYSIPWFITYFASRVGSAEIILELWDRMAQANQTPNNQSSGQSAAGDPTFIFFFAVALIVHNRARILKSD